MSAPQSAPAVESKEQVKPSNRVYCRWEVTDEALKTIFEKIGKVSDVRVVRGPRMRSYGFVTFENEADAAKAIATMNGKAVVASPVTMEFAATERGPRKRPPRRSGDVSPTAEAPAGVTSQRQPRRPRQPAQPSAGIQPKEGVEGAQKATRRRRNRRVVAADRNDPHFGKVVLLRPDPISNPIPKDASVVELVAGQHQYRPGVTTGKMISSLILNADPTKGPFNCDFKLGDFELKLLSVSVNSKPGDCRIGARILHPASNKLREAYLRVRNNSESRGKFFELVKPGAQETTDPQMQEVFFVGIDSIVLDENTGLWKKIILSLVSAIVPKRVPRAREGSPTGGVTPSATAPAPVTH